MCVRQLRRNRAGKKGVRSVCGVRMNRKKAERILRTGYGGSDCTIVRKHRGTGQSETGKYRSVTKREKAEETFSFIPDRTCSSCVAVVTGIIVWQYGSLHHGMTDSKRVSADNAERKISGSRKIRIAESYDEIYKYIKQSQGNEGIAMYARSGNETSAAADAGSGNETSAAAMEQMADIRRPMSGSPV